MKNHMISNPQASDYNKAVRRAYFKTVRALKNLLATLENYEPRCSLERTESTFINDPKVHEFLTPLIYLCLAYNTDSNLEISFGFEQFNDPNEYSAITAQFLRLLNNNTSRIATTVFIEDCICTHYVITDCSALYEVIDDAKTPHKFKAIPYKPNVEKRNMMKAVA